MASRTQFMEQVEAQAFTGRAIARLSLVSFEVVERINQRPPYRRVNINICTVCDGARFLSTGPCRQCAGSGRSEPCR